MSKREEYKKAIDDRNYWADLIKPYGLKVSGFTEKWQALLIDGLGRAVDCNACLRDAIITREKNIVLDGIRTAVEICHEASKAAGWWSDLETGESLVGKRNKGEMLCLIHSEISEAMEGERKNLMDDKLPHRRMAEVELADAIIRIFDYCGAHGYDLAGAFAEKIAYNANRADHKPENRAKDGGKKF